MLLPRLGERGELCACDQVDGDGPGFVTVLLSHADDDLAWLRSPLFKGQMDGSTMLGPGYDQSLAGLNIIAPYAVISVCRQVIVDK